MEMCLGDNILPKKSKKENTKMFDTCSNSCSKNDSINFLGSILSLK